MPPQPEYNLYEHQARAVEFLHRRQGVAGLFLEQRTGKTRAALAYLDQVDAKRILIIGPNIAASGWEGEIGLTPISGNRRWINLTRAGTVEQRSWALDLLGNDAAIVFTNFETCWREPLATAILRWQPDAVVVDEAHNIRYNSKQTNFVLLLVRGNKRKRPRYDPSVVRYRLALTGTPMGRGMEDLYRPYRFLNPTVFGDTWRAFEERYLVMDRFVPHKVKSYKNKDEVQQKLAETSFRVTRAECFDLPPVQHIPLEVPLSPKSAKAYCGMRDDYVAQLEHHLSDGTPVESQAVARIVLTAIMRLQQITSGFCSSDDGQEIDLGDDKLEACLHIILPLVAEGEKVVVFCRFSRDIARLVAGLKKHHLEPQVLTGKTTARERDHIIAGGRWTATSPVLVAQIKTGSQGFSATAASSAVFYSTGFSLIDFQQARDRLMGPDQTRKVGYYYLLGVVAGEETVDHKVYHTLDANQSISQVLLRDKHPVEVILGSRRAS